MPKQALGGKAPAAQGAAFGTPAARPAALGALMRGGVDAELAPGRGAFLLLLGRQALVEQGALGTGPACPIDRHALGIGGLDWLHLRAVGTHQLPLVVPDEGIGMKDPRRPRATAPGDARVDGVRLTVAMHFVPVEGAVQAQTFGITAENGVVFVQSLQRRGRFDTIERHDDHCHNDPALGVDQQAAALAAQGAIRAGMADRSIGIAKCLR